MSQDSGQDFEGTMPADSAGADAVTILRKPLHYGVLFAENGREWLLQKSWFQSRLMPLLPRQLRWLLRTLYLAPIDFADRLLGRHDPNLPPKAANFTGSAGPDFASRGRGLLDALVGVAGLSPASSLLDVGCGVGKLAVAMTDFLDSEGKYDGFDIVPGGIEWCRKHIRGRYNNITFTLADVYNKEYNPKGKLQPADYRFPYEDETFDVVALYSVFTHMLPEDVDRYLSEISRVLRKCGKVFATYYVINPKSLELMRASGCALQFKRDLGSHWLQNGRVPELSIAYNETYLADIYSSNGLSEFTVYPGSWCGRSDYWVPGTEFGAQDVLVASKL